MMNIQGLRGGDPFVITKTEKELLVVYSPKNGAAFVDENIRINGECRVASGVLIFKQDDVKDFGSQNIGSRTFVLARQTHDPQGYYLTPGDMDQVLALYRRSMSFAVATRRYNLNQLLGMTVELPEAKDNPLLQATILNWGIMLRYDMDCTYRPSFDSDAAERLEFVWRVIPRNIGISCASGIPPLEDEAGDRLVGELIDYSTRTMKGPRPIVSFNVVPEVDRTHVVLIWDKQFLPYINDVRVEISASDKTVVERFFNDALLNRSEDFTVSPDLWEGLSESERNAIRELIIPEHMRRKVEVPRLVSLDDIGPVVKMPSTS